MLLARVDGIKNKIEPHEPVDEDLYELPPDEHAAIPTVPTNLAAVMEALHEDHDYLLEAWVDYKRIQEIVPVSLRPHPHEFELYFDL